MDDATFSITPTCTGGSTLILGTTGGVFTFASAPLDAEVIDAVTGVVSNGTSGVSYNIVYTTSGGCPANSTETLTVLTTDDPSFMISPTCDGGISAVLGTPGGVFTFNSSPTDTASINSTTGAITGGSPASSYEVIYVTSGACPSISVEMVTADDCTILIIPTAFTPNSDGDNDQWEILELDFKYPNNIVHVFNRWGDLIFKHQSSVSQPYDSNRWDGTYKGTIQPVGSYYYIIDFNDGNSESATGTISIILIN
jgi:gliding motility-associated-like protein